MPTYTHLRILEYSNGGETHNIFVKFICNRMSVCLAHENQLQKYIPCKSFTSGKLREKTTSAYYRLVHLQIVLNKTQ